MSDDIATYADCPIVFGTLRITHEMHRSIEFTQISPMETDDGSNPEGLGNPVGYLDPQSPPFPRQKDVIAVSVAATYTRRYLREFSFGQCACWTGFQLGTPESPAFGMSSDVTTEGGDTVFGAPSAQLVEWINTHLSPGEFVALSSCCEPGNIYILAHAESATGTATQTIKTWQDNHGTDAWGAPTYDLVQTDSTATLSAAAIITGGLPGKNWPGGGGFQVAVKLIDVSPSDPPVEFNLYDSDPTFPDPAVGPWNCVPGTVTTTVDGSLPATTWLERDWSTGLETGNTTTDGPLTFTITTSVELAA